MSTLALLLTASHAATQTQTVSTFVDLAAATSTLVGGDSLEILLPAGTTINMMDAITINDLDGPIELSIVSPGASTLSGASLADDKGFFNCFSVCHLYLSNVSIACTSSSSTSSVILYSAGQPDGQPKTASHRSSLHACRMCGVMKARAFR
jgi:hypothetical protein